MSRRASPRAAAPAEPGITPGLSTVVRRDFVSCRAACWLLATVLLLLGHQRLNDTLHSLAGLPVAGIKLRLDLLHELLLPDFSLHHRCGVQPELKHALQRQDQVGRGQDAA